MPVPVAILPVVQVKQLIYNFLQFFLFQDTLLAVHCRTEVTEQNLFWLLCTKKKGSCCNQMQTLTLPKYCDIFLSVFFFFFKITDKHSRTACLDHRNHCLLKQMCWKPETGQV